MVMEMEEKGKGGVQGYVQLLKCSSWVWALFAVWMVWNSRKAKRAHLWALFCLLSFCLTS